MGWGKSALLEKTLSDRHVFVRRLICLNVPGRWTEMNNHRHGFKKISKLAWLPVLLLCAATAYAQVTTIDFTGRVLGDNALNARGIWGGGTLGWDVTGSFSYQAGLVDSLSSNTTFDKFLSISPNAGTSWSMTFALGGVTQTITEADGLFNFSLFRNASGDHYSFTGADNKASIALNSSSSVLALNGVVPTSAPILGQFDGLNQGIYNVPENGVNFANFLKFDIVTMSSPVVTAVPEPEIYAMMGLGLGLIGWVGRKKRKLKQAAPA